MTTCYEKADSLSIKAANKGSSASITYCVLDTDNELDAIASAMAIAPEVYEFSFAGSIVLLVKSSANAKQTSQSTWEVDVEWSDESSDKSQQKNSDQPIENMVKWSFDTTGQTLKMTVAKKEVARGQRSESYPAPDLYGAIGWDGKELHGVDRVIPSLKITATAPYKPFVVTKEWIANLARATGKTNSKDWQGFKAGELLYKGSTGEKDVPLTRGLRRQKPIDISHNFEASENVAPYTVGAITIEEGKKGWEYAWVRFEQVDDASSIVYPKPVHAYIDQIYDEVDFKKLFGF